MHIIYIYIYIYMRTYIVYIGHITEELLHGGYEIRPCSMVNSLYEGQVWGDDKGE